MAEKRLPPKKAVAKNLRAAMTYAKVSAPQIAKIAGVDRKTVTNWLNGIYDPSHDLLDEVAKSMGFDGWQLLMPDFDPAAKVDKARIAELIQLFNAADDYGKDSILRIAEMASRAKR